MGSTTFNLKLGGIVIATTTIPNFSVKSGWNYNMEAISEMVQTDEKTTAALNLFFSEWMVGNNQTLQIEGPVKADWSPLLYAVNTDVVIMGTH